MATRTSRNTVAVLALLAGRLTEGLPGAASLRPAVERLAALIDGRDAWLDAAAERMDRATSLDVLGDAADRGTVEQAALMFREGPRLTAVAHDTGDWLHTAVYTVLPGHRALLVRGAATDAEVVETIARRGGETIVVGSGIAGARLAIRVEGDSPIERGLVASVVAELLAAELWRRADAAEVAGD